MNISFSGSTMTGARYRWVSLALGLASVLIAAMGLLTATRGAASVTDSLAVAPPPAVEVTVKAGELKTPVNAPGAPAPALGPINPTIPVSVSVDQGELRAVQVVDAKSRQPVPGELGADGKSWLSKAPLAYASTYQVTTTAVGGDQREVQGVATVATLKPDKLAAASFIPAPNAGSVGVGQPLVVRFSRAVTDKAAAERALQVETSPNQPGSWYWMSATEAHYRGPAYWKAGSTIKLTANLFGVDLGNKVFGQADRTMTVKTRDAWIARADGASKQMQIFHNGALVRTMPVSLGSPKNPSHNGPHVVTTREPFRIMDSCTYGVCEGEPDYYRQKVDLAVRISSSGEFVHSAPWSVRQQGVSNVSHGCVNLSPANARWFFDNFAIGDVVEITNSGGPTLPAWDTYGDWTLSWSQWQAGSALS